MAVKKPAAVTGPLGKKPGDSWVDAQGNLWIVSTTGQAVNLGAGFGGDFTYQGLTYQSNELGVATGFSSTSAVAGDPATPNISLDWESVLGVYGLPADVIAEVRRIWNSTDDSQQAAMLAIGYVRGTPWYAQTFPGIQEGFRLGIVANERDYRAYTNELNQVYRRFYGRDVGGAEVASWLKQGADPNLIAGKLGGEAYVKAYGGDTQYVAGAFSEGRLTAEELTAFGEQKAGLQSTQGTVLERRVNQALERARRAAEGVLASPNLTTGTGRLSAPGLGKPSDTSR
jgi:hypothetical protein